MIKIPFNRHNINDEDINEVITVLKSQFITTSEKTAEFENLLSNFLGNKYTIGVNSATAGLHLLLHTLNLSHNDEVITTPLTFVSTINVIEMVGAKPILVDVDPHTGLIDLDKVANAINKNTKAIIPVHLYGNMVNIKKLTEIIKNTNIKIIEDSAHCIEGSIDNIKPGNLSYGAVFSFYATKNITSGEGGAISTNNHELNEKLRILRLHGLSKDAYTRYKKFSQYDVEYVGYKYNMYDIQAALLINQIKRIENSLKKREKIYTEYTKFFDELGINYIKIPPKVKSAYHLMVILVDEKIRDKLINFLQENGIGVSVHFKPIHQFTYYKNKYNFKDNDFPNATNIYKRSISLPLYPSLTDFELEYILNTIKKFLKK